VSKELKFSSMSCPNLIKHQLKYHALLNTKYSTFIFLNMQLIASFTNKKTHIPQQNGGVSQNSKAHKRKRSP
jgi:hypothetical protein